MDLTQAKRQILACKICLLGTLWNVAEAVPTRPAVPAGKHPPKQSVLLKEFKHTAEFKLLVGQIRLLRSDARVIRTSVGAPSIAEPIVVAENQVYLLGRGPGQTNVTLWGDDGSVSGFSLVVSSCVAAPVECKLPLEPASGIPIMHTSLSLEESSMEKDDLSYFNHMVNQPDSKAMNPGNKKEARIDRDPAKKTLCKRGPVIYMTPGQITEIPRSSGYVIDPSMSNDDVAIFRDYHTRNAMKSMIYALSPGKTTLKLEMFQWGDYKRGPIENLEIVVNKAPKFAVIPHMVLQGLCGEKRDFRTEETMTKILSGNSSLAEPLLFAPTDFEILFKAAGRTTLSIEDVTGRRFALDLFIDDVSGSKRPFPSKVKETLIEPVSVQGFIKKEIEVGKSLELEESVPKMLKMKSSIIRTAVGASSIVELIPKNDRLFVHGKSPGQTSMFLWDMSGDVIGIEVRVLPKGTPCSAPAFLSNSERSPEESRYEKDLEMEDWMGNKKRIWHLVE